MKKLFLMVIMGLNLIAHPVGYSIDLETKYDNGKFILKCKSSSKNKCGLYSFNILDENEEIIKTKRYPFFKKNISVEIDKKPSKLIFFLRKTPAHNYVKIIK